MSQTANEREKKYRGGYREGFRQALYYIERGDSTERLKAFKEDELDPWYNQWRDINVTLEPAPKLKQK